MATEEIDRTTFGDMAGRVVTYADPSAPHQITLNVDGVPADQVSA